jgi:dihydroxyacetone synthase
MTGDGTVDITNTENIKAKFEACNWQVLEVEDGSNDVDGIVAALEELKKSTSKPTLVIVYTVIGVDTGKAGTAAAHGAAYGQEEVDKLHELYGFSVDKKYYVPKEVYDFFSDVIPRGEAAIDLWNSLVAKYAKEHPEIAEEFQSRVKGQLPKDWKSLIPSTFPDSPTASRKSSGIVVDSLAAGVNSLIVGTADLDPSVNLKWKGRKIFQKPDHKPGCGVTGDYTGRFIHYGIREHAMAAISNGISAFNKGTFIPVTSTFFMFYLYAAPAVRYGALSHLQVIHVATHDSIGTGEDGPTHHPIALAALYRAMPNMLYIRPCDSNETAAAWEIAMEAKTTPSIISLSRQNLPQYPQYATKEGVAKGAYMFIEQPNAVLNLISSGSEMFLAVGTAEKLKEKGIIANVISFPCQRLFEAQPLEYKRNLLKRGKIPSVAIEAYAPTGWERYATAGINMRTFGKSLPGAEVYKYFGFDTEVITPKIEKYLEAWKEDPSLSYEFQDL